MKIVKVGSSLLLAALVGLLPAGLSAQNIDTMRDVTDERLRNPEFVAAEGADKPARPATFDVTRDTAAFRRLVRTEILLFLQEVSARAWESAASRLQTGETAVPGENEPATAEAQRVAGAFAPYFDTRGRFRLDPEGRAAKHTHWSGESGDSEWTIAQVLVDPEENNDWEVTLVVSLAESRAANRAVIRFESVHPIGSA